MYMCMECVITAHFYMPILIFSVSLLLSDEVCLFESYTCNSEFNGIYQLLLFKYEWLAFCVEYMVLGGDKRGLAICACVRALGSMDTSFGMPYWCCSRHVML